MKFLIYVIIAFACSISNINGQHWTCVGTANTGVYQNPRPELNKVYITAEGGIYTIEWNYDAVLGFWLYTFVPTEEKDYTIFYEEWFLGWKVEHTAIDSYQVVRTNLVLNTPITSPPYSSRGLNSVTLAPGFSISASSTNFVAKIVSCSNPGARIQAPEINSSQPKIIISNKEKEFEKNIDFSFYPNPVSDRIIKITINEKHLPGRVRIYQMNGASLIEKSVSSILQEIDLPETFTPDIYIISFESENGFAYRGKLLIH